MKKQDRPYRMYLEDIILAMGRIMEYTSGMNYDIFVNDQKTVDAVVRNFEVIGEATRNIPDRVKSTYPEVPWDEMYLLRNKVTHEYFGVDCEIIWDIAKGHLPRNLEQIEAIIQAF